MQARIRLLSQCKVKIRIASISYQSNRQHSPRFAPQNTQKHSIVTMAKDAIEKMENESSDYYECILTPKNAPDDNKSGITINGSNDQYIEAHLKLLEILNVKGDRYIINNTEVGYLILLRRNLWL